MIRCKLMIRPELVVRSSIILPGVQTMTSDPRFISAMLSLSGVPPYAQDACRIVPSSVLVYEESGRGLTRSPRALRNGLHSLWICVASSLVGVTTMAMGPSIVRRGRWSLMCRNMGRRNATVLPDPVLATPMMSRPDMMAGMAWA